MKRNVLIVSDNKDDYSYLSDSISTVPGMYEVTYAESPQQALRNVRRCVPHMIFVRLAMPGGLYFLCVVKQIKTWRSAPFYLFGEMITEQESKMAETLGASGCIEKKMEVSIFRHELRALFNPDLVPRFIYLPNRHTPVFYPLLTRTDFSSD